MAGVGVHERRHVVVHLGQHVIERRRAAGVQCPRQLLLARQAVTDHTLDLADGARHQRAMARGQRRERQAAQLTQ